MDEKPTARPPLSPSQLFQRFERGEIDRDELHARMAEHALGLIREMEEDRRNPAAAWIEALRCRAAVTALVARHSGRLVREVLIALSEVPGFPPALQLWNAAHPDVPLHCFIRVKRPPMFRITSMRNDGKELRVSIEWSNGENPEVRRSRFRMRRDGSWKLKALPDSHRPGRRTRS
jgi:hypothetical protein